jgi:hypothetical protein
MCPGSRSRHIACDAGCAAHTASAVGRQSALAVDAIAMKAVKMSGTLMISARYAYLQIDTPTNIKYARIDPDRFIDSGERNFELAVAMQDEAAIDAGGGKVRIEFDSSIEIGNRPVMATRTRLGRGRSRYWRQRS